MEHSIIGQRFNRLVILEYLGRTGNENRHTYLCRCDCGTEKKIIGKEVKAGKVKSCGCLAREVSKTRGEILTINLLGQKFGKLLVVAKSEKSLKSGHALWICLCDCGAKSVVSSNLLRMKKTTSCGCLARQLVGKRSRTHGMAQSQEYRIWCNMKARCLNPNRKCYVDYGARGITVCDRWLISFENFLEDMGPRPGPRYSLDRIDNDGNYAPSNCHWATRQEQIENRRVSIKVDYQGEKSTLIAVARKLGLSYFSLRYHYSVLGKPIEKAVESACYADL